MVVVVTATVVCVTFVVVVGFGVVICGEVGAVICGELGEVICGGSTGGTSLGMVTAGCVLWATTVVAVDSVVVAVVEFSADTCVLPVVVLVGTVVVVAGAVVVAGSGFCVWVLPQAHRHNSKRSTKSRDTTLFMENPSFP